MQYYPLYGATLGIAIPAGRLGNEHAAGYHIGGLVEFAVPNQPYALRAEAKVPVIGVIEPGDFTVDEKSRQIYLTEAGNENAESLLFKAGVIVEGASLLVSQRSEFAAVIERQDIDGMLAELRARAGPASS